MIADLKKAIINFIYLRNNCSFPIDVDFWSDLVDFDLEEVYFDV